jgi:hypothetical protein
MHSRNYHTEGDVRMGLVMIRMCMNIPSPYGMSLYSFQGKPLYSFQKVCFVISPVHFVTSGVFLYSRDTLCFLKNYWLCFYWSKSGITINVVYGTIVYKGVSLKKDYTTSSSLWS